uniref:TCF3 fusion partner n=1 Tax=Myotis myotis TaxID=51298 RepID=A0A7J7VIC0_MYOMY|nr:hypothetical protein mMyoMyo1_008323 [Myotis myotis]
MEEAACRCQDPGGSQEPENWATIVIGEVGWGREEGMSAGSQEKMELEQREGCMAAVGFEEFSAPPCLELALPLLFRGHILESELETEVEFMSGGLGNSSLQERDEEEEAAQGQQPRCQGELNCRKYQVLGRRCREIERVLNRLHQI